MLNFFLAPFVFMVCVSLYRGASSPVPGSGGEWTLSHYRAILSGTHVHFLRHLWNSTVVCAMASLGTTVVAALAAYAFTRFRFASRDGLLFLTLAVSMFPPICLAGYLFRMMTALGWINTYRALIFPYIAWTLPVSVWILTSYFSRIPRDLDRAALVDGLPPLGVLLKVIVPVARPALGSVFLIAFITAFNEFLLALMLTTDHDARTVPVGIALFQGMHGQIPWGTVSAASVLTTFPVIAAALIYQKNILTGLTRGALKE
jgi:multiple sugar transport system permease protein